MASETAKIEVYEDDAGEFRWRMRARNGSITADSAEGYSERYGAKRAARRFLQVASGHVEVVEEF